MRLPHKLLLVALSAAGALAVAPATASAEVEILSETGEGHCPAVTIQVHTVTGGCHLEVLSPQPKTLVVQTAGGPVVVASCDVHAEARIGEDGSGWITEATLTTPNPPPNPPCTRTRCDEASGAMIPWPISIAENGPGDESGEATLCLRTVSGGPGSSGFQCEVHMTLTDLGAHEYELGPTDTRPCENVPTVSITDLGFVYEGDSERVEIVH